MAKKEDAPSKADVKRLIGYLSKTERFVDVAGKSPQTQATFDVKADMAKSKEQLLSESEALLKAMDDKVTATLAPMVESSEKVMAALTKLDERMARIEKKLDEIPIGTTYEDLM